MGATEAPEVCESGLWVDSATGEVVGAPPATGYQLVPPGGQLRPDRVRAIEAARAAGPPAPEPEADPGQPKAKRSRAVAKD